MTTPSSSSSSTALLCEIHTSHASVAQSLQEIAAHCARDLGQTLTFKAALTPRPRRGNPVSSSLTLHLPVELAANQHPIWCLTCRLACFLPDTRVTVLIQGAHAFSSSHPVHHRDDQTASRARTRKTSARTGKQFALLAC